MDFKPHTEVVLPPEKGTGIRPDRARARKRTEERALSLPPPREIHYSNDMVLVMDEKEPVDTVTVLAPSPPPAGASPSSAGPSEGTAVETPASAPEATTAPSSGPQAGAPRAGDTDPAPAGGMAPWVLEPGTAEVPAEGQAPGREQPPSTGRNEAPPGAPRARRDVRDFIIAYDGRFIGHFRSLKRITNRKAFVKAAQRLVDVIDDFDLERLEIFKPVALAVARPENAEEIREEIFNWFTPDPSQDPEITPLREI